MRALRPNQIFPGFRLTLGVTVLFLGLVVLLPLSALVLKAVSGGWEKGWETITHPRLLSAYRLSFGVALLAALFNGIVGFAAAWVLTRYSFPGRRLLDTLVDLPIALPTAVAGIALTALYAPNGWIGEPLLKWGIKVAYTPAGIFVALSFIGLPFVVRSLQPVLESLPLELEEGAACLGATRFQTFRRVILPALVPAWISGMLMAFGRGVGEYGSVVFIAGNLPFESEIVPLLIIGRLEEYDYAGAAAIGVVMLAASLAILLSVLAVSRRMGRRAGGRS